MIKRGKPDFQCSHREDPFYLHTVSSDTWLRCRLSRPVRSKRSSSCTCEWAKRHLLELYHQRPFWTSVREGSPKREPSLLQQDAAASSAWTECTLQVRRNTVTATAVDIRMHFHTSPNKPGFLKGFGPKKKLLRTHPFFIVSGGSKVKCLSLLLLFILW